MRSWLARATTVVLAAVLSSAGQCVSLFGSSSSSSSSDPTCPDFHILMDNAQLLLAYAPVNSFQMNQYLLGCKSTGVAAIVDCGDPHIHSWISLAGQHSLKIQHFLQTHAHVDHICGLKDSKDVISNATIYLHAGDLVWYNAALTQSQYFGLPCKQPPEVNVFVKDNDVIHIGSIELRVVETPGHSPGSVVYHSPTHKLLFTGDLLFRGSIGRTDFPYSEATAMVSSLRKLKMLPTIEDGTLVLPGHMEPSTMGKEKAENPYLRTSETKGGGGGHL